MNKLALISIVAATALLTGCSNNKAEVENEEQCLEVKPGTIQSVNAVCVIMPSHPVNPATKCVDFNGKKIGFCCAGCIGKWEAMTAEQKQAALDKAMAVAKK